MQPKDYWEVSMIEIEDGMEPQYADFLASTWRRNQEFAKSKGWIKDYHVLGNSYGRDGEPDLYLIVRMARLETPQEEQQRRKEFEAFNKRTQRELMVDSGTRAKMRTLKGGMLLREFAFSK